MAAQVKARSSELYEQDLYAWSEVQADLLRRRRFAELDLERVVEEIVVGKTAEERTETVRDKVRRKDVEVERTGTGADDRTHRRQ